MIYVVTHKDISLELPNNYKIIGVGNNKVLNEDCHDNTFDNISEKNKNYCELTALYWIWKNVNESTVGLDHYRRLFTTPEENSVELLKYDDALSILKKYDIILPPLFDNKDKTVYEHYCQDHVKKDIDAIYNLINKLYPNYKDSFNYIMNQKYEYGFNMFISNKEICNDYCKWIFDILMNLEKHINLDNYDDYQKRVFGFLSERLFTIWIYYNKLNIKELVITNPFIDKEIAISKKIKKLKRDTISL